MEGKEEDEVVVVPKWKVSHVTAVNLEEEPANAPAVQPQPQAKQPAETAHGTSAFSLGTHSYFYSTLPLFHRHSVLNQIIHQLI